MPLLLRTVRQNRWHKDAAAPFLADDDVPADPLCDLNTKDNMLSVWVLSENSANLIERVVRAVAIGKQHLEHSGYVTFDSKVLEDAGIQVIEEPGTTKDAEANAWHRNLVLSGNKVVALAKGILRDGDSGQILKQRLKELISEGVQQGHLPSEVQAMFEKK